MADRPPPARGRGPRRALGPRARALVERAEATDRRTRFAQRLAGVRADRARWRRRRRLLDVMSLGVLPLLRRVAARRGASAWDWRARRHRLMGDPSRDVQRLDRDDRSEAR